MEYMQFYHTRNNMGRRKKYSRRFLIGLDKVQAQTLVAMSNCLGLTYSEVVGYLMNYYQLATGEYSGK